MRRTRLVAAVAGLALIAGAALASPVMEPRWVDAWRQDLAFLQKQLIDIHPDPFRHLSRRELVAEIDALASRLPALAHHQAVVELSRVLACLHDGHTRLTLPLPAGTDFFLGHSKTPLPAVPGLVFRQLPVRFWIFEDGLHVIRAAPELADTAGARVIALGKLSAEEAMAAVSPMVHRDNPHQLRFQLPDYLAIPEVLHAVGLTDEPERVRLVIATAAGERRELTLTARAADQAIEWTEAFPVDDPPRYLARREEPFWLESVDGGRTLYFQFNEVANGPDETLAEFSRRLSHTLSQEGVERLILDLRWNRGGGGHLNRVLLHELIRSRKLQRPGAFFVITGGGTFSAAMMLAIDLERHTNAIFVGEPTGSSPNHYGDSRKLRLPETGLTVRISTLFWQYSDPRDDREAIRPHLPITATGADYRAGRDPLLVALLEPPPLSEPGGSWRGALTVFRYDAELRLELDRQGEGWKGYVDLALLELERAPVEELEIAETTLRFRLPTPRFDLRVEALREGARLYGLATRSDAGLSYPFVLLYEN